MKDEDDTHWECGGELREHIISPRWYGVNSQEGSGISIAIGESWEINFPLNSTLLINQRKAWVVFPADKQRAARTDTTQQCCSLLIGVFFPSPTTAAGAKQPFAPLIAHWWKHTTDAILSLHGCRTGAAVNFDSIFSPNTRGLFSALDWLRDVKQQWCQWHCLKAASAHLHGLNLNFSMFMFAELCWFWIWESLSYAASWSSKWTCSVSPHKTLEEKQNQSQPQHQNSHLWVLNSILSCAERHSVITRREQHQNPLCFWNDVDLQRWWFLQNW